MTSNRVIQDSDDEDDPLSCEAQPPPPVMSSRRENTNWDDKFSAVSDESVQININDNQIRAEINNVGDIGVNFDDFLQSQDAQRRPSISSSQQRREERWIPGGIGNGIARGSGSIAFMMSEIDMAQRRLFDDDAPYTGPQIPSTATVPFTESGLGHIDHQQQQQGLHGVGDGTLVYPEGYPQAQVSLDPGLHPEWYNSDQNQWVENALEYNDGAAHASISTSDRTQSNTSYNAYESALQGLTDPSVPLPHETIQTEILNRTPIRSKSLHEAAIHSPHDTEPFSSARSPNLSRSRSDNTCPYRAPEQHSQTNATDELSAPVAVEIPVVQKKAPEKKKPQPQPEDDDDDELAAHSGSKGNTLRTEEASRSRSNKQVVDSIDVNEPHEHMETSTTHPVSDEANPSDDTHSTNPDYDEIHLIQLDAPKNQPPELERETRLAEPPKPPRKDPKRKKLKRGKTTSVTLKKTYEPGVEDDVIWVDPSNINFQRNDNRPDSIPTPDSISTPAGDQDMVAAVEVPMTGGGREQGGSNPEPAPKKRGNKRKKTSEQPPVSAEEASTSANERPPVQPPSNVSVIVDKPANDLSSSNKQTPNPPNNPSTIDETLSPSAPAPAPESGPGPTSNAPETPKKPNPSPDNSNQGQEQSAADESTISTNNDCKGPSKHSPIAGTSKVPYRVGLSRRARIAPLLKVIRK